LQRHRRCDQFSELLTTNYGYLIPDDLKNTELEEEYKNAMNSIELYGDENVIYNTNLYQYMIPLGYLHRSIFQMDLRQLYYISELKITPNISYKKIINEMYKIAKKLYPDLIQWCKIV